MLAKALPLLVLAAVLWLSASLQGWLAAHLIRPFHLTGWLGLLLLVALLLVACRSLRATEEAAARRRLGGWTLYTGIAATAVLAFHFAFRLPQGPLEIVLFALTAGVAATGLGAGFCARLAGDPRRRRQAEELLALHLPLLVCLLPIAAVHGIAAHAHGYLSALLGVQQ